MTAGTIMDNTGAYTVAYVAAAVLCPLAAGLTFVTKAPEPIRAMQAGLKADDEAGRSAA